MARLAFAAPGRYVAGSVHREAVAQAGAAGLYQRRVAVSGRGVRRSERSCLASNIVSTAISTTARKTLINRPVSGNSACNGSNRPDRPSAFFPPMVSSPNTFDRDVTSSPPRLIDKRWSNAFRVGRSHRARGSVGSNPDGAPPPSWPMNTSTNNKLTMPYLCSTTEFRASFLLIYRIIPL